MIIMLHVNVSRYDEAQWCDVYRKRKGQMRGGSQRVYNICYIDGPGPNISVHR